MGTAAAPALETSGGSSTSSISNVDTLEALDLSDIASVSGTETAELQDKPIPESMILGGKRPVEAEEADETPVSDGKRNPDGTFAKKKEDEPAPESAAPVLSPFKYRAMGETHELEGATVNEKGDVTVPAAKMGELREAYNALHLTRGHYQPVIEKKEAENATLRAQVAQMAESRTLNDTKAEQLVNGITAIMENPNDQEALTQLYNLKKAWPTLTAKATAAYWEQEAKRGATAKVEAPKPEPAPQARSAMPAPDDAKAIAREHIEQLKIDHRSSELRGMSPEDWKQFEDDSDAAPFAYLRLATVEDAQKHPGVQPGQVVFDRDLQANAARTFATRRAQERETAKGQRTLAVDNARRTQPSVDAPPVPGGGRTATSPKRGKAITTKQELEDWWDSDKI
jgi:hypothetical protein